MVCLGKSTVVSTLATQSFAALSFAGTAAAASHLHCTIISSMLAGNKPMWLGMWICVCLAVTATTRLAVVKRSIFPATGCGSCPKICGGQPLCPLILPCYKRSNFVHHKLRRSRLYQACLLHIYDASCQPALPASTATIIKLLVQSCTCPWRQQQCMTALQTHQCPRQHMCMHIEQSLAHNCIFRPRMLRISCCWCHLLYCCPKVCQHQLAQLELLISCSHIAAPLTCSCCCCWAVRSCRIHTSFC